MFRKLIPPFLLTATVAASAQEKITWQDHIRPIFENRCNNCHNADKKKGDLDLSTFAGVLAGGSGGASVEAGDSAASTLWKVVSHSEEPMMPPKGDKIPQAEIDLIGKWITGGLLDTPDGTAKVKKKAAFAMAATSSSARPEGPPPLPEHLLLEPVVTPVRANVAGALAHSPWAPLTALAAPRQVLLYHSGTGELLGVLPFPEGGTPETLSFSRNGALLLAGGGIAGKQGTVVVWDVKTGQPVINLAMKEDFDTILAADISSDLGRVAMGGPGRRVRIYNTRTSQLLANIKKHTDWVTALAFSPDGVLLATGDRNGGLYVWEADTGNEFHNLRAHEKRIASLAWRGDSNLLAAGSEDGNMTWWEMANGTQVKKLASHGGVLALNYASDGRLVSGGRDGHVRIWDGNAQQLRDWVPSGGEVVLEAIFNDDGTRVLTGAWNGEVKVQNLSAETPAMVLALNPPSIETRLAALEIEIRSHRQAKLPTASVLAEKEKLVALAENDLASLRATIKDCSTRHEEVLGRAERQQAELVKLAAGEKGFADSMEASRKQLAAAPASIPARPGPVPGSADPKITAVLELATAAEVSLAALSKAVLEKTVEALQQAVMDCDKVLTLRRAEAAQTAAEADTIKTELAVLTQKLPEKERALMALKQDAASSAQAVAAAGLQAGELERSLARWKAAQYQKEAFALRREARTLTEKLDSAREELAALEATVITAPAASQANRLAELKQIVTVLPAEAGAKQKSADSAWQQYLAMLPR